MKICAIHLTKTHVVIYREHKLPGTDYAVLRPAIKLERSGITIALLGQAMMDVLDMPGILEARLDSKVNVKAMFEFAGFKSWRAFANATELNCGIVVNQNEVKIEPSFRDGPGFSGDQSKFVTCELTVESLGKTLFTVLGL